MYKMYISTIVYINCIYIFVCIKCEHAYVFVYTHMYVCMYAHASNLPQKLSTLFFTTGSLKHLDLANTAQLCDW